jgi:hypothetical protein
MEFVYQIDNHLPKDICEKMIEKYKNDPNKIKSKVGDNPALPGSLNEGVRKSTTLNISDGGEWSEIDKYLENNLKEGLEKYKKYISDLVTCNVVHEVFGAVTMDSGYSIQEMKKDDFYTWHVDDFLKTNSDKRIITVMWYLNTLEEDDGGHTEFWMKNRIRPKQGTILFFPSGWSYIHRGGIVKNDVTKYTCITWLINK